MFLCECVIYLEAAAAIFVCVWFAIQYLSTTTGSQNHTVLYHTIPTATSSVE